MLLPIVILLLIGGVSPVRAQQDWGAVEALPAEAQVRVHEQGGREGMLRGRLVRADASQIVVRAAGRQVSVPRDSIASVDIERQDPVWEGMIIGALYAIAMRVAFSGDACAQAAEPQCTLAGIALGAGAGALIDRQIRGHRRVYEAMPRALLLRLSF